MNISDIKKLYKGEFFKKHTMEFWGTRVFPEVVKIGEGKYGFVTEENMSIASTKKRYSIRCFIEESGKIVTVGAFLGFISKEEATIELRRMAK